MRHIKCFLCLLLYFFSLSLYAYEKEIRGLLVKYDINPNGKGILISSIRNNTSDTVSISFSDSAKEYHLPPHQTKSFAGLSCRTILSKGLPIWRLTEIEEEIKRIENEKSASLAGKESETTTKEDKAQETRNSSKQDELQMSAGKENKDRSLTDKEAAKTTDKPVEIEKFEADIRSSIKGVTLDVVVNKFRQHLNGIPFYSDDEINELTRLVDQKIAGLGQTDNRDEGLIKMRSFVDNENLAIANSNEEARGMILDFLQQFRQKGLVKKDDTVDSLCQMVSDKLNQRQSQIARLEDVLAKEEASKRNGFDFWAWKNLLSLGALVFLLFSLGVWYVKANKRKNKQTTSPAIQIGGGSSNTSGISIPGHGKTITLLREQNLDDVINNEAYLRVDCSDFCDESAVRRMYIKNTCIKEIYNMYAEDLRNENNPKEDGCMVIGRWVYDKDSKEYYVSLEQVIMPGDDAVFEEYELNFGGKIKLKVYQALKKLRRGTQLQYDLTCWVHSHPGLGVFFSNSDNNVQMQLKHPMHPHFLTAIVIDILTPDQELGIFTFKRDGTVNARSDIHNLYSLEEWYRWAVESERKALEADNYYDILQSASSHADKAKSVFLNNSAIIDTDQLLVEQRSGLVGFVHGFSRKKGIATEFVINKVAKEQKVPDNDMLGCLVSTAHFSLPSVRKAIAAYEQQVAFVLVYSSAEGLLTCIPAGKTGLMTDFNYYGEKQFEELRIWTRRRR